MNPQRLWMFLLVVGLIGCADKPTPNVGHPATEATVSETAQVEGASEKLFDLSEQQKAAFAEIEKLGGTVEVDEDSPGQPVVMVTLAGTVTVTVLALTAIFDAMETGVPELTDIVELS